VALTGHRTIGSNKIVGVKIPSKINGKNRNVEFYKRLHGKIQCIPAVQNLLHLRDSGTGYKCYHLLTYLLTYIKNNNLICFKLCRFHLTETGRHNCSSHQPDTLFGPKYSKNAFAACRSPQQTHYMYLEQKNSLFGFKGPLRCGRKRRERGRRGKEKGTEKTGENTLPMNFWLRPRVGKLLYCFCCSASLA